MNPPPLRRSQSILVALALCAIGVTAQETSNWERIKPYLSPPPELAGKEGGYRSPLVFEDGSMAKTAEDWRRRRAEIVEKWTALLGKTPALIERPKLEIVEAAARENFTQHKIRVEVASGRMTAGYLLVPKGEQGKRYPAVVVPFYEPETSIGQVVASKGAFRDYAYQLAKRGFVTLAIGSPGGDARKPEPGKPAWQPLSYLAYVAANCANALAGREDVDPKRIGIVGHSYGGKWAMFASCLYPEQFAAAVWSDPGIVFDEKRSNVNYWEPWYIGLDSALSEQRKPGVITAERPRTGPYKVMVERGMDLHELHALMAPRPFLVSAGSEDPPERWVALNHTVAVNKVLGVENRVGMHNRKEHSPNAEANEVVYAFFEHFLRDVGEKK